jgi:hypothetical protein
VQLVAQRRPLIKPWIDSAKYLGAEGRHFLLGFPPSEKTIMESLSRPNNRSFLEGLLKEVSGTEWTLKMSLVEGLSVFAAQKELSSPKTNDPHESFKDDPLIKEALELFKGEIKSVTT